MFIILSTYILIWIVVVQCVPSNCVYCQTFLVVMLNENRVDIVCRHILIVVYYYYFHKICKSESNTSSLSCCDAVERMLRLLSLLSITMGAVTL